VKKGDNLFQCVKADIFLRVRNCQYNGTYLQNQAPSCLRCERGYVLAKDGTLCSIDTVKSSRLNIGVPGCAFDYGAFSIGIRDYDRNQQICRYTWLLPPFSLHLAISILVVCSIVALIYFHINPVKKHNRQNNFSQQQNQQQPGDFYQNVGNGDQTIETSPAGRNTDDQRQNGGDLQLSLEDSQNLKSE